MESAVEVALPAAIAAARLMGSPEGLGSGGVVVGEVRWGAKDACSSGGRKDDIHAINTLAPSFWRKIHDSRPCLGASQPYSLHSDDVSNDRNLGKMNSLPTTQDIDVNLVQKSGKIGRKSSGCAKTSRMIPVESSKHKPGLHDINWISPEVIASSSASRIISDKNQLIKQKNNSTSRRGDKINSKVKNKNRCDPFTLKNGLVGFNSAAGGNNFFGMYGLKHEVFDITNYVKDLSLHELLHGSCSSPCIAKDKGKKVASSNDDLLQSFRKACSILEVQKVLQARNCVGSDNSCIQRVTVNSTVGQTDSRKGDFYTAAPSSNKVQESRDRSKMSSVADSTLYTPKEILHRLALPPPKDLDLLLSDASKAICSSKTTTDLRLGKSVAHRIGLPPFPWSNSYSGNSKSGSDTVKLSTNRATCQGRWLKVKDSSALQKGSADFLADFESLAFDQSLVPSTNLMSEHQENKFSSIELAFSSSITFSTSEVPAHEHSPTYAAAQTLLDMAAHSKGKPCAAVKMKEPSQMTMKASKSKAIKRPDFFDGPKSTIRPTNYLKISDHGLSSSKKPKLSSDALFDHTKPIRKGKSYQSELLSFKSPPRKQFSDSIANTDSCVTNPVKKTFVGKTPRSTDRAPGSTLKLWKPSL